MNLKTIIGDGGATGGGYRGQYGHQKAIEDMEKKFNEWVASHSACRIIRTHVDYIQNDRCYCVLLIFYSNPA